MSRGDREGGRDEPVTADDVDAAGAAAGEGGPALHERQRLAHRGVMRLADGLANVS